MTTALPACATFDDDAHNERYVARIVDLATHSGRYPEPLWVAILYVLTSDPAVLATLAPFVDPRSPDVYSIRWLRALRRGGTLSEHAELLVSAALAVVESVVVPPDRPWMATETVPASLESLVMRAMLLFNLVWLKYCCLISFDSCPSAASVRRLYDPRTLAEGLTDGTITIRVG